MTFHRNRSSAAALAAPFLFASLLPAQGYIAMTATQVPQTNAPAGVADAGIAARADGSWVVFGGEQSNGLLANTFVVNNNVWQPRISLFNPALRTGHQFAFDGVRGDSVMFGGKDVLGNALGDTWVFANDQWSYRPTPSPSARSGHRMCFDAARGVVVLFGGKDAAQTLLSDTWTWNGSAWAQVATAVAPVARHEHGVAYDAYRQKVVLFGGEAASGLRSDVWDWDGASWVEVVPPLVNGVAFGPVARKQHAMGFDAVGERVVVAGGGRTGGVQLGDAWAFDGDCWSGLFVVSGSQPSARSRSTQVSLTGGRFRFFGGGISGAYVNDIWMLEPSLFSQATDYGVPCLGSAGPLELRVVAGSQPVLGSSINLRMTGASSSFAAGLGFIGLSRTGVQGVPLPVDLAAVGIPGCNAYQSAEYSVPLGLPAGSPLSTNWSLLIPWDRYLLGSEFFLQALSLEPFGFSRFATTTNGVSVRIGEISNAPFTIVNVVESFLGETFLEESVSGGVWADGARPAQLGGDGRHGSFNITNGTGLGDNVFEWNVDSVTIPGSQTFGGQAATVTDGRFFFTDFVVPVGATVRFTGSNPVQIHVRGNIEVNGRIQANGVDQVTFNCRNPQLTLPNNPVLGQVGSGGGPGGGRGGQGGDRCFGLGALPENDGRNGEDLRLPGGHAYANVATGTGGRGSPIHPLHGSSPLLSTPVNTYTSGGVFNSNVGFGGSGGGYGLQGLVASNSPVVPNVVQFLPAAPIVGGIAFDPLPIPLPSTSSLSHFLIGGSGGGGGGSHPFLGLAPNVTTFNADRWKAGGGGTGGGGAIAFRGGRDIYVEANGRIEVRGGRGASYNGDNPTTPSQDSVALATGQHWGIPVPGGGGSGGTVLLQASRNVVAEGIINASGGNGSYTDNIIPNTGAASLDIDNRGGNGAPGFYRLEAAGLAVATNASNVPAFQPMRHSGVLRGVDRDTASGCRSKWRATGLAVPPEWLRYEVQVDSDGDGTVDRIYSDDLQVTNSLGAANDPLGPVRMRFQGTRFRADGSPDPATTGPWRDFVGNQSGVGIQTDAPTGVRFELTFNTLAFPSCVVKRVEFFARRFQ